MITRKFSLLFLFSCFSALSFAQTAIPYSRFGIGILQNPEPAWMKGWGGVSAAFHNPYNINYMNPASYSYLSFTTLEAGFYGSYLKVRTAPDSVASFNDGGLGSLVLGLPVVKNKVGMSFGITPFSRVEYNIVQNNDSIEGVGQSANNFTGSGSLYKFHVGAGYRWKGLSVGMNVAYLFGNLDYSTILSFPDTLNAFGTLRDESRIFGDFVFDAGIQYRFVLGEKKDHYIDLGAYGDLKTAVNCTRDLMYVRFTPYDDNGALQSSPQPKDTVSNIHETGDVVFPPMISGGIMFTKLSHFMVGVNYDYAMWSDYSSFGEKDITTNSWKISAGAQFIPNYLSYQEYWKIVAYRAGFSISKNYLQVNDKNLIQYNANVGAGFPVRRLASEISFAAEWSKLGNLNDNPLAISNFRFTVGVTLNDHWFVKRKYD